MTITDDDTATVTLAVDTDTTDPGKQTSIGESDGAATVRVTATLSTERSADTTLTLRIDGGDAVSTGARKDYDPSGDLTDGSVDITIAAGQTSGTADVEITPVADRFDEDDETVIIGAAASGGLSVTGDTVTITDDDDPSTTVTLVVDTDTIEMGNQASIGESDGATTVRVTATLDDAVRSTATAVELMLSGTAVRGSTDDYEVAGIMTVTIPADEVSGQRTITITPVGERIDDGDKTIIIRGTAPVGSNLDVTGADDITLVDDDDAPTAIELTVAPASVREQGPVGGAGLTTSVTIIASFAGTDSDVTLVTDTPVALSVHADSTASRGSSGDYTAPSTLGDTGADITIEAGQTSASTTVEFTSVQDNVSEGDETIIIDGAATGFDVAAADRATIDFTDDDAPSTSLTLRASACIPSPGDTVCTDTLIPGFLEGTEHTMLTITAELDGSASTDDIDVTLAILTNVVRDEIHATLGDLKDYTASSNLTDSDVDITILATETSATTTVTLIPRVDRVDDDNEIIRIGGTATGSITVNDWEITIGDRETASTEVTLTKSSGPDSFTEDHGVDVPYQIVATLAGDIAHRADTPVTLVFGGSAAPGADCATAGVDYTVTPSPAVITIAAETTTGDATVTLTPCNPDPEDPESPETIEITGTADFGADTGVLPVTSGFDVILEDDDLPVVTLATERVTPQATTPACARAARPRSGSPPAATPPRPPSGWWCRCRCWPTIPPRAAATTTGR